MRPYIVGRAGRVHLTPFAAGLSCGAALSLVPLVNAFAANATPPPLPVLESLVAIGGAPANGSATKLLTQIATPVLPVHTELHIKRRELNVLDGRSAAVIGALSPALSARVIDLQRLGRHGWQTIAHNHTGRGGRFVLRYVPHRLISERIRVIFAGDARDLAVKRDVGRLSSYRLVDASWYGGGGELACGGQLTSSTMGVASKTLPCGTLVTLRYGGRSVRVPVVDRGPYVVGREFDLTEATKRALGFEGVNEVWSNR